MTCRIISTTDSPITSLNSSTAFFDRAASRYETTGVDDGGSPCTEHSHPNHEVHPPLPGPEEIRSAAAREPWKATMTHSPTPTPSIEEQTAPPLGGISQAVAYCLIRLRPGTYHRVKDERGALTTEMMILTAVLCLIAVAAYALLNGAMGDAADQIDVNIDSGG